MQMVVAKIYLDSIFSTEDFEGQKEKAMEEFIGSIVTLD